MGITLKIKCDFCPSERDIFHLKISDWICIDICWRCFVRLCRILDTNIINLTGKYGYLELSEEFKTALFELKRKMYNEIHTLSDEVIKQVIKQPEGKELK